METKYIIIIAVALIGTYLYSFGMVRYAAFRTNDVLQYSKKYFWNFIFLLNRGFNNEIFRYLLIVLALGMAIFGIYYQFNVF